MTSIIALIPARSGSKGVIHKNLRSLAGHSLLAWSIKACSKTKLIDKIIVSTDSPQYADHARQYGADVPFLRPAEFSKDTSVDHEFLLHAISWLSSHQSIPQYIVHIRPTTPFRSPSVIDSAIETVMNNSEATALRSVHRMPESAFKSFSMSETGYLTLINGSEDIESGNNARQSFPVTYKANGYVDVLSSDHILSTGRIHGNKTLPFITNYTEEIDTEDDLFRHQCKLRSHPELYRELFE